MSCISLPKTFSSRGKSLNWSRIAVAFSQFDTVTRFHKLKAKDNDFEVRFANLGNIYYKPGITELSWDLGNANSNNNDEEEEDILSSNH